jgi:HK97 family phage major capsid protein
VPVHTVTTASPVFRIPIVDEDASSAWVPEGNDIVTNDATVDEEQVTPLKVAALVRISSELAEDSSPEAAGLVQASLARSVARSIDRAFFANTTANGPNGLLSLNDVQLVDAGSTFTDFDWATSAKTKLRKVGSVATNFVASADTVEALETIKTFNGSQINSNEPLMNDETPNGVADAAPGNVLGVPLVAVADGLSLDDNLIWALDRRKVFAVMRRNVTLDVSPHYFFGSDSIGVRITCRVGFGFPHPQAIVKVGAGGS